MIAGNLSYRFGVDVGGTKIEILALDPHGTERLRRRIPTPHGYERLVQAVTELVQTAEREIGTTGSVGVGIPGIISPATGLVKNASTTMLNGRPFDRDLSASLKREVRVENDANCFALSEATDGAGAGAHCVFGVIVGTGCGGGVVIDGRVLRGHHGVTGEWGHTPLPWPLPEELPGTQCWCGMRNCVETYVSGPSLARDCDGPAARDASSLPGRAAAGEQQARAALARHVDRMARGLAVVIDILDPDVIVLGGGLSNMDHLYRELPPLLNRYVFSDRVDTPVVKNTHGDSSGVRGAAWLWPA